MRWKLVAILGLGILYIGYCLQIRKSEEFPVCEMREIGFSPTGAKV
jgi:hypothetical protein